MLALIIEDEAVSARSLASLVGEFAPELRLEAPLATVGAAIARLSREPAPDLLLMDVHLADGTCFDILEAVPATAPIIFTTAHDEFALKAFEVFGIDYLLKPIRPERLRQALEKWRQLERGKATAPEASRDLARAYFNTARRYRERFLVAMGEAMRSIPVGEIAYFHKDLAVRLVTRDGRGHVLAQSLDELEAMLDPERFFRANRQFVVAIDAIARVHRGFKGRLELELSPPSAETVIVSQERAAALRAWLDR